MKTGKFTEEQIAFALKQAVLGTKVEKICHKRGISEATFYNWEKKFGGLGSSGLRRLRQTALYQEIVRNTRMHNMQRRKEHSVVNARIVIETAYRDTLADGKAINLRDHRRASEDQGGAQCELDARRELVGHHLLPVNLAAVDNERSVTNRVNRPLLFACSIDVCGTPL